ncbi:MAG TPA: PqqD family peptide modification chaperone [Longimicrobium sp.]|nr:PqqD family peptide modification chaperone [Longimicrobium sp.]
MTEPALSPDAVVVAARDQVSADLEGEAVILNLADGVYYGLDGVGARIWELLREPRRVAELAGTVAAEYDVDPGRAEHDVVALLAELLDRRLVEIVA